MSNVIGRETASEHTIDSLVRQHRSIAILEAPHQYNFYSYKM